MRKENSHKENLFILSGICFTGYCVSFSNWLHDWRRRRKTYRRFMESRKRLRGQPATFDEAPEEKREISQEQAARLRAARAKAAQSKAAEEERPARAVPRLHSSLARRCRIVLWRKTRPLRRLPAHTLIGGFFGILLLVSGALTLWALWPSPAADPALSPARADESSQSASHESWRLDAPPATNRQLGVTRLSMEETQQQQAAAMELFRAGRHAEAEARFRDILPTVRYRGLIGFYIFLCLIQQGHDYEAKLFTARFPAPPLPQNPARLCAQAVFAWKNGNLEHARESIQKARQEFPTTVIFYEQALHEAALPGFETVFATESP